MRIEERGITLHQCSRCRASKSESEFHKGKKGRPSGYCKSCAYEYNKERRLADPKAHALSQRKNRYGLTDEQVAALLSSGRCDLCRKPSAKLHIDHDHACCPGLRSCGRCIRGALCVRCNIGLGIFGDTEEGLERAIDYLQKGYKF